MEIVKGKCILALLEITELSKNAQEFWENSAEEEYLNVW